MAEGEAPTRGGKDADRFRNLIDAVADHAIFALSPDGLVESWNSGARRIKGYEADEIIGQPYARFYAPEDQAAGKPEQALRAAAADGRFEDEAWRVRKDGTRFRAAIIIEAIRDACGRLTGFAKVTRDVTARYELERTREQLHQAQKQELVGQLAGGLAHDFNNLLTAITGSFDLIGRFSDDERVDRLVQAGSLAAARGQKLVAQLLAFARQQQLYNEMSDVNALIEVLYDLLVSAVGTGISVELRLDPGLPRIMVDPAQFQSALLNLIVNARDAMPDGGRLGIVTALRERPDSAPGMPAGRYVVVEVADTGTGMEEDVRRRAIEPFFTTKRPGGGVSMGSGLGLSQVDGFAQQSGGALEIESKPGQGSRLRLLLPESAQPMQDEGLVPARQRAVLLVEDDENVRKVADEMLSALGFTVYAAADAAEALLLLQRDTPIDLLFTDIVMPGMNGAELARRAITLRPNLRVLLASAHPRKVLERNHDLRAEVVLLQKPYRMAVLERAVGNVLTDGADAVVHGQN